MRQVFFRPSWLHFQLFCSLGMFTVLFFCGRLIAVLINDVLSWSVTSYPDQYSDLISRERNFCLRPDLWQDQGHSSCRYGTYQWTCSCGCGSLPLRLRGCGYYHHTQVSEGPTRSNDLLPQRIEGGHQTRKGGSEVPWAANFFSRKFVEISIHRCCSRRLRVEVRSLILPISFLIFTLFALISCDTAGILRLRR